MRKLIAILLMLTLAIPLILAAQIAVSVNIFAFDRSFYLKGLNSSDIYNVITTDEKLNKILDENLPFIPTDKSPLNNVIRSVFSPDYFNGQMSIFINGLFDYLEGDTHSFNPVLDLLPIKEKIYNEMQQEILTTFLDVIPVCPPEQLPFLDPENNTICKLEGLSDEVITELLLKPILPLIISMIPDQISIGGDWENILTIKRIGSIDIELPIPNGFLLITILISLAALISLYTIAALGCDAWQMRLQWMGWSLAISSVLIFGFGLALSTHLAGIWVESVFQHTILNTLSLDTILREMLIAAVHNLIPMTANYFQKVSGLCGIFGLALIFWGYLSTKKSSQLEKGLT
jgi:hypothetical protein